MLTGPCIGAASRACVIAKCILCYLVNIYAATVPGAFTSCNQLRAGKAGTRECKTKAECCCSGYLLKSLSWWTTVMRVQQLQVLASAIPGFLFSFTHCV